MIREITEIDRIACTCPECGNWLTNPGYNKPSVFCCGKYRRWYNIYEVNILKDDGRDEKGRFHHKPFIISKTRNLVFKGGE